MTRTIRRQILKVRNDGFIMTGEANIEDDGTEDEDDDEVD